MSPYDRCRVVSRQSSLIHLHAYDSKEIHDHTGINLKAIISSFTLCMIKSLVQSRRYLRLEN